MNITEFMTTDGFLARGQRGEEGKISTFQEHFAHLYSSNDLEPMRVEGAPLAKQDTGLLEKEVIFEFLNELATSDDDAIFGLDSIFNEQEIDHKLAKSSMHPLNSDEISKNPLSAPFPPAEKYGHATSQKHSKKPPEVNLSAQFIAGSVDKLQQAKTQTHIPLSDDNHASDSLPNTNVEKRPVQISPLEWTHKSIGSDNPNMNKENTLPSLSLSKPLAQLAENLLPTKKHPVAFDQHSNESQPILPNKKGKPLEVLPPLDPTTATKSVKPSSDIELLNKPIHVKNLDQIDTIENIKVPKNNVQVDLPTLETDKPGLNLKPDDPVSVKNSPYQSLNTDTCNQPLEKQVLSNPASRNARLEIGSVAKEVEFVTPSNIAPKTELPTLDSATADNKKLESILAKSSDQPTQVVPQLLNNVPNVGSIFPIDLIELSEPQISAATQFDPSTVTAHKALVLEKPPHPVAQQIALQLLEQVMSKGQGNFGITLSPKELGRVEFSFQSLDKSGLTITILTERDETAALVKRHMDVLTKELERLGYTEICFSCEGQSGRQGSKENSLKWDQENTETDEQSTQSHKARISVTSYGLSTALDIRL